MTEQERNEMKAFYEEKEAEWKLNVKTAETRTKLQMRKDAQHLKDYLFCLAGALADGQQFSDTQIKNLRHWVSGMYDELSRLGLMQAGELRYRE